MSSHVALVTNIPRPYRRALFAVLKEQLAAHDLELRVLYTSDPSKHQRRGSLPATVEDPEVESYIHGATLRFGYERVTAIPTGLRRALSRLKPVCVVIGGFSTDAALGFYWCRRAKVPYVLWSGAWSGQHQRASWLRSVTRKRLISGAQTYIAYGTAAADYLATLGAGPDRVFCAWNTVDLEGIAYAARAAVSRRPELTHKYGLTARNLLYVGTLVESKGLRELVSAALSVEVRGTDWALHFVGAGPLRDEMERTVRMAGKEAHFRFHGLRPGSDVAELLGFAHGLFLPTKQEAWGLVINEAMACGVPVVASPLAGATRDLIEDGVSGYVVETGDTKSLAAIMIRLVEDDPRCKEVGKAGARAVRAKASLQNSAEGFVSAVRCAIAGYRDGQH